MKTQNFFPLAALAILFVPSSVTAGPLADRIGERIKEFSAKAPETTKKSYAEGIQAVVASGITQSAKQAGEKAPDFTLKNADGENRTLSEMLKKGPVVLTWYRGGWCPYCNLTLLALQEQLPEFKAAGVQLVALTPELPDKAAATTAKNKLEFEVLTDLNHEKARGYGIVFKLTPEVRDLYQAKFSLTEFNGLKAGNGELPLAATYLITPDGKIRYAFLHADYRERAEPAELVTFIRQLLPQAGDAAPVKLLKEFWLRVWNPPYDLTAVDELLTDDFILTNPGGEIAGKPAFKAWLTDFHRKLGDSRLMPAETFASADGTRVVSRWTASGTNHGLLGTADDGKPAEFTGTAIWEVRDGKLARNWVQRSALELHRTLTGKL